MKAVVDSSGRVVIPRSLRDSLGLIAGRVVEIRESDGKVEVETAPTRMELVDRGLGLAAVSRESLPPLTDNIVRATLERTRR